MVNSIEIVNLCPLKINVQDIFLLILLLLKQQLQKSPLLFKMFIDVTRARNCGDGLLY